MAVWERKLLKCAEIDLKNLIYFIFLLIIIIFLLYRFFFSYFRNQIILTGDVRYSLYSKNSICEWKIDVQ